MSDQSLVENNIKMTGDVIIVKTDMNGNEIERREIKNLVVDTGKSFIASRMASNSTNVMSHMAIGTGTTAATSSQTALVAQIGNATMTGTNTANSVTYVSTFAAGVGTGAITEAGIFNGSTGTPIMLCRTTFPVVNKQAGDSITITWVVTVN